MMLPDEFNTWRQRSIAEMAADRHLSSLSKEWFQSANSRRYSYHFDWMGRPIIQYPTDMVALQEIIWRTQPNVIIETGIAHGGSVVFSASMLALLDLCFPERLMWGQSRVVAVDVDIRSHNRTALQQHPLFRYMFLIEGSSTDSSVIEEVISHSSEAPRTMVILDSNHTHEHVLAELRNYAPLVTAGCYVVVMDTVIENLPEDAFPDRSWSPGNSPMTALAEFLQDHPNFVSDEEVDCKLLTSVAPCGFVLRTS